MSQNTSTQMCVIAEQVINYNVPVEAVRGLDEAHRLARATRSKSDG
jgi:hypothetical protein